MKKRTMLLCLLGAGMMWVPNMATAGTNRTSMGVMAPDDEVTGIVSDANGPLIGATVKIVGSTTGTVTDFDGNFKMACKPGTMLEISYIGYVTQQVKAQKGMKVVLKEDGKMIDEVVVTALGIKRERKALGYALSEVKGEELTKAKETNVINSLAGKVAGLVVNQTAGGASGSSRVLLRGNTEISGDNQPLYVIDGVPLDNTNFASAGTYGGYDLGDGISAINPDDIENMTVLKGPAASALYGSRASHGVILITTKKAEKDKISVEYNGSITIDSQLAKWDNTQQDYGQGWNGTQTFIENGSWGPELDGSTQVYGPIWNHQQLIHKYEALESNIEDFFETGISTNHSVALSGVSDDQKMTYYLSYGYSGDNGIIPGGKDKYKHNTIAFNSSYEPINWFKLTSGIDFAKTKSNLVGSYQGTSFIDGILEFPRDISLVDRKDLSSPFNTPEAWYTPYGITNPYWAIANNHNSNDAKQIHGRIQADIKPLRQLTLTYRFGFDYTDFDIKIGMPQITLDDALINENYGYAPSEMNQDGWVFSRYRRSYETNHDFLANWNDKYLGGKLDVNIVAGVNMNERYSTYMQGQTDLLTFNTGFWDLSNGATKSDLSEGQSKRRLVGLFGDVTLGWDDMLYLGLTARNDWSSTLPINDNSYFYPGVTLSWIFTKLIPKNDILDFGKIRLAYGKTGNDASPYQTSARFIQGTSRAYYGSDVASFPMSGSRNMTSPYTYVRLTPMCFTAL